MARKSTAQIIEIGGQVPTNGAERTFMASEPYIASITICGTADYLFHAWNVEAVEAKSKAAKGSSAKKSDDLESYVYRNEDGVLSIPGEQFRMSLINAAKYKQDPRSPRKSAMDLYKAGLVVLTTMASLGKSKWDYEDRRRVVIQRNAITRTRPAMKKGWTAKFDIQVILPEYIIPADLNEVAAKAGMFCCVGDFRPTYGRFQITNFVICG